MENKKNKLEIVDINKLETEEDIREAIDYLHSFRRRATFFTAACLYWTFDFGMTGASASDPSLQYLCYALSGLCAFLGGRCYLRRQEAKYEIPEVETQKRKILSEKYGFIRK